MKMPKGPMRGRGMPVPKGAIKKGTLSRLLKLVFKYYKPHKKMLMLDLLASLLISVIGMVYPIVTNKMLNVYIPEKSRISLLFFCFSIQFS